MGSTHKKNLRIDCSHFFEGGKIMIHKDRNIIYEPTGPAREYAALACNIYKGCQHACRYCYGKRRLSPSGKADYDSNPNPKLHFLEKLKYKAEELFSEKALAGLNNDIDNWRRGKDGEILLSFLGDVYQPAEMELMLTRGALEILIENELPFTILTKGGSRACRDFDLLEQGNARFGTTLIFMDQKKADYWEPGAASIKDRIEAIREAHERNIVTWVSLEPVIDPAEAMRVVYELHTIVDHWKIGKINHTPEIEHCHNWIAFREEISFFLDDIEADYILKKSLTEHARDSLISEHRRPWPVSRALILQRESEGS